MGLHLQPDIVGYFCPSRVSFLDTTGVILIQDGLADDLAQTLVQSAISSTKPQVFAESTYTPPVAITTATPIFFGHERCIPQSIGIGSKIRMKSLMILYQPKTVTSLILSRHLEPWGWAQSYCKLHPAIIGRHRKILMTADMKDHKMMMGPRTKQTHRSRESILKIRNRRIRTASLANNIPIT